MQYIVCFTLALIVLIVGIVRTIWSHRNKKDNLNRISSVNSLIITTFITGTVLFLPMCYSHFRTEVYDILGSLLSYVKIILISIHSVFRLFLVDGDYDFVVANAKHAPGFLSSWYILLVMIIFIFAPILTFTAILSLLKNAYASVAFLLSYNKDVYVFSELNKKTIALATSIKTNHPNAKIVFTDVFENDTEENYNLLNKAKSISAILFKKDLEDIRYNYHSKDKKITMLMMGSDETENVRQAVSTIEKYRNRPNTELYVVSRKIEGELLLSSMDKGSIKLRRINDDRSIVSNYLYESGIELFDNANHEEGNEAKQISAVIFGLGGFGTEMTKALAWFCQMEGFEINISAYDKNPKARDLFAASCPELIDEKYNKNKNPNDAIYSLEIHSGIDVETKQLMDGIKEDKSPSFVFVSLGDDNLNIRLAVKLRTEYERMGCHPQIVAIVEDSFISDKLENIHNYRDQQYDIDFMGSTDETYSEKTIMESELEKWALEVHKMWGDEEEFWQYEYNYRSSVATAIHNQVLYHFGLVDSDGNMPLGEKETARLEHRRWNAYMRSEGYSYSGTRDKSSRNDLAKMHPDLVPFDQLSESDFKKDIDAIRGTAKLFKQKWESENS
ncbi:MAG: hypothetical protein K6E58_02700 [Eubacterium sp.]|nr:hypothetical protein [Eubacterium sp.]